MDDEILAYLFEEYPDETDMTEDGLDSIIVPMSRDTKHTQFYEQ